MNNSPTLSVKEKEAFAFAIDFHVGQKRKLSGYPFIIHLMETHKIVTSFSASESCRVISILHDVFEDTAANETEIEAKFGIDVLNGIIVLSEGKKVGMTQEEKRLSWLERKKEHLEKMNNMTHESVIIMFSDKLSNMVETIQFCTGIELFNKTFNASPKETYIYYREVYLKSKNFLLRPLGISLSRLYSFTKIEENFECYRNRLKLYKNKFCPEFKEIQTF